MDIRRQYSLPNCTLVLDGYSDTTGSVTGGVAGLDTRPLMSILVNAECHFTGNLKPLSGGRDFFESLVTAVSGYAQELLSGVPHPETHTSSLGGVYVQRVEGNLHRLMVQPASYQGQDNGTLSAINPEGVFLDLTTVQLFDLVEAIDQFLADTRTLPDLLLHLTPVSKRDAVSSEPIAKRATPAAVGVTTLALAAIAFSLVPLPKVQPPKEQVPGPQSSATTEPSPSSSSSATPAATPSNTPTGQPTPNAAATAPPTSDLQALIKSAPEITDPTQLGFLQRRLYTKINQAWVDRRREGESLVYLLGVGQDGAIVGYKPINQAAGDRAKSTPLPELAYTPTSGKGSNQEPIAQFKVVFTNRGILQVSPWNGLSSKPGLGPEIREQDQLKNLSQQLSEQLKKNWTGTASSKRNLVYRVAVNKDGAIADYEPKNQPAFDYEKETPLPNLLKSGNLGEAVGKEPLAQFQVVFKPSGALEVGPLPGNR